MDRFLGTVSLGFARGDSDREDCEVHVVVHGEGHGQ